MLYARDIMVTKLLTFRPDQDIHDAIDRLLARKVSGAPVLDGGDLVGMLSERNCMNLVVQAAAHELPPALLVRDFMRRDPQTINEDNDILSIAALFLARNFRRLPVINAERKLVGQVSRRDVLAAARQIREVDVTPSYPDYRRPQGG